VSLDIDSYSEKSRFVVDTTALISYFDIVFEQGTQISKKATRLIETAFETEYENILIIPGVVFVEIFDKWFRKNRGEEFRAKFRAEVFEPIRQAPNIEIREVDEEVLETFLALQDYDVNLENRDRLILASAIVLNAPLITSDGKVIKFVKKHKVIPNIVS
jgi:predicted nucleic acid-binding protein